MTGTELRTLRNSTGLSQEKFGVLVLGCSGVAVSKWECGRNPISSLKAAGIEAVVAKYLRKMKRKS